MDAGDGITKGAGQWTFSDGVSEVFEDHARKSIPGYDMGHDLICKVSDQFISIESRVVDIGCSTGALLKKLSARHAPKSPVLIGIDREPEMIGHAQKNSEGHDLAFECVNALEFSYQDCDLINMYYVLQFVKPKHRQELLDRVRAEMNWGGGLIIFEKVRGSDARFNDILTSCYWEFKSDNGFTESEIISKWRSLRGVMEPFSEAGNLGLLQRAGWTDIETIWKWGPFQGFLAIK